MLIAMSESEKNPITEKNQNEKENNVESELERRERVKAIMSLLSDAIDSNNELNKFLDIAVDNPFYFKTDKVAFKVVVEFSKPMLTPYHVSLSVFNADVEIVGIEIEGAMVKLKYKANDNGIHVYKIELDNVKLSIKDLYLLLYVLSFMDINDFATLKMRLFTARGAMQYEKELIIYRLESNGVKIEN